VSWAQRTPKKLRLEPTSEQLQRCGCPYILRQAVPNSRCGCSKGTVFRTATVIAVGLHKLSRIISPALFFRSPPNTDSAPELQTTVLTANLCSFFFSNLSSLGFQDRDSYIETPTSDDATLADSSQSFPPMMINRNVSSILPRPPQRTVYSVSSPPAVDDLTPFNWYQELLLLLLLFWGLMHRGYIGPLNLVRLSISLLK